MPTVSKLLNCRAPLRPRLRRLPTPGRFMGGGGPPLGAERRPLPRHRCRGISGSLAVGALPGVSAPGARCSAPACGGWLRLGRPALFRPPRCGAVPCRRAALGPQSGGPPRGGRPSFAAWRSPLAAGLRLAPPLPVSARLAWRLVLPGGGSWVAAWRLRLQGGSARLRRSPAPPAAIPAPAPRGRPLGCALRACRFGAPPPGARWRPLRRPPVFRARAPRRGFARLRRAGAQGPMLGLSPCGDYEIKGENLCTPETRRTEPAPSPSGPCSEHSSGPGSTTRKHHKKF